MLMNVRMVQQDLVPRVQDCHESDPGAETSRIGRDLKQRLGGGAKEYAVDDSLVLECDGSQLRRHREHDVEVLDRKNIAATRLEPLAAPGGLTFGAVTVAAGVVGDALVLAPAAMLDVPAKPRSAARRQRMQDSSLGGRQGEPGDLHGGVGKGSDDVGHLQRRPGHAQSASAIRSSGLLVAVICSRVTCE